MSSPFFLSFPRREHVLEDEASLTNGRSRRNENEVQ